MSEISHPHRRRNVSRGAEDVEIPWNFFIIVEWNGMEYIFADYAT